VLALLLLCCGSFDVLCGIENRNIWPLPGLPTFQVGCCFCCCCFILLFTASLLLLLLAEQRRLHSAGFSCVASCINIIVLLLQYIRDLKGRERERRKEESLE